MRLAVALVSAFCLFLQGCTTMQPVQVPQSGTGPAAVQVGDTVELTTRAGRQHRFQVTEVTDDALVGQDMRVSYADIADLKTARQDETKSKSVMWVLGGVALVALLIGAASGGGSSY
ncbi:MAG: hypothetical protein WD793_09680 [Steroidobacteraceae bacterium]